MKDEEFLKHFGILGMHWGRRKDGSPGSSQHAEDDDIYELSEDHKTKMRMKSRRVSTLSNVELRSFNERLQLERQYRDLTKVETSPGKKWVMDILMNTATEMAKTYSKKYATQGMDALLKMATAKTKSTTTS